MLYEKKFLFSLLATLVVEIPVVFYLVKYFYKIKDIKTFKIIFIGFLASTLTLPYLWFILPAFISDRSSYLLFGELAVIFIETIIYQQLFKISIKKAFIVSLVANIASIIVGLWIS